MQHLDEGTIHAWLDDALAHDERVAVEEHLDVCMACAELVVEARGLIAASSRVVSSLDGVQRGVLPKQAASAAGASFWRTMHLTPMRAALAASLLVAAGTVFTVRRGSPTRAIAEHDSAAIWQAASGGGRAQAAGLNSVSKVRVDSVAERPKSVATAPIATAPIAAVPVAAAPPAAVPVAAAPPAAAPVANASAVREIANASGSPEVATLGCFTVSSDGVTWPSELPRRFALQHSADSTRNIMRVIRDGHLDSVVAGAEWRQRPPNISLSFASNDGVRTILLDRSDSQVQDVVVTSIGTNSTSTAGEMIGQVQQANARARTRAAAEARAAMSAASVAGASPVPILGTPCPR